VGPGRVHELFLQYGPLRAVALPGLRAERLDVEGGEPLLAGPQLPLGLAAGVPLAQGAFIFGTEAPTKPLPALSQHDGGDGQHHHHHHGHRDPGHRHAGHVCLLESGESMSARDRPSGPVEAGGRPPADSPGPAVELVLLEPTSPACHTDTANPERRHHHSRSPGGARAMRTVWRLYGRRPGSAALVRRRRTRHAEGV
jgi:hypothetical protein